MINNIQKLCKSVLKKTLTNTPPSCVGLFQDFALVYTNYIQFKETFISLTQVLLVTVLFFSICMSLYNCILSKFKLYSIFLIKQRSNTGKIAIEWTEKTQKSNVSGILPEREKVALIQVYQNELFFYYATFSLNKNVHVCTKEHNRNAIMLVLFLQICH